jgi:endonuclease/exonuclease/phosphatase family metal-dependent hydrolase
MASHPDLICATWNVHRAVGRDGRLDGVGVVDAILSGIAPRRPRILALQEADSDDPPHPALLDLDRLAEGTGLRSVHDGDDMRWSPEGGGFLGNVLFLDPEMEVSSRRIVDLPGRVPRAAVLAETVTDGAPLRVVSCHLSLSQALRAVQMRTLGQVVARAPEMQTILLGDLNEWRPWRGLALSGWASGLALSGPARRTFPSGGPLLPLDRILTDRGGAVHDAQALPDPAFASASDHLPLLARVTRGGTA